MRAYVRRIAKTIAGGDEHLADDLEQSTLLVALQSQPDDSRARRPWLYSVCANLWRSRASRDRFVQEVDTLDRSSEDSDPARLALDDEQRRAIQSALGAVPPLQLEALRLRFVQGLGPSEMARKLDVPVETARSRVKRGLLTMRAEIERSNERRHERVGRWSFAFLIPRRRPRTTVALGSGVAVGALLVGAIVAVDRGVAPPVPESNTQVANATRSTLAAAEDVGSKRTALTDATCSVQLSASEDLSRRWGDRFEVSLVPAEGDERSAELATGAIVAVHGLEPGVYRAIVDGVEVDRATLAPGPQDWTIDWGAGVLVDVRVATPGGGPALGAELFEYRVGRAPALVGTTDESGRATVQVSSYDCWIAARGGPGSASDGALVGQPETWGGGTIDLELTSSRVHWIRVDTSLLPFPADWRLEPWVDRTHLPCYHSGDQGLQLVSQWLPPWEGADGALGFRNPLESWALVLLDGDDEPQWVSPRFDVASPPPPTITPRRAMTIRGRVVDVDGEPVPHCSLRLAGPRKRIRHFDRCTADSQGRFVLSTSQTEGRVGIMTLGQRVTDVDVEPSGSVDLGDVTIRKGRAVETRIVGGTGRVEATTIPLWYSSVSDARLLARERTPLKTTNVGEDGRLTVTWRRGNSTGVFITCEGDEPTRRRRVIVPIPQDRRQSFPGSIDLSKALGAHLHGSIDPGALPCIGAAVEIDHGVSLPLRFDASSGAFFADCVPAGRWRVLVQDRLGRILTSSEPVRCIDGDRVDVGAIAPYSATVQVLLPVDQVTPEDLGASLLRIEQAGRAVATRRVGESAARLGLLELDLPPGEHAVTLTCPAHTFVTGVLADPDDVSICELRSDGLRCHLSGWFTMIDPGSDAQVEVFGGDGELLKTVRFEDARRNAREKLLLGCPRRSELEFVVTAGEVIHATKIEVDPSWPEISVRFESSAIGLTHRELRDIVPSR
ncbi:MAG: RNA polymerase sigma factor [Planctomycetota bacterium]